MATLQGDPVDRPAVCFYELNGLDEDPTDPDPFNVYSDPSWGPLLELTRERTDRIVMRHVPLRDGPPDPLEALTTVERRAESDSRITLRTVRAGRRTLRSVTRRDPGTNTLWTVEPLLKDVGDLEAWLDLPERPVGGAPDPAGVTDAERRLGESGIVMIDTADPLCCVAPLFGLGEFTVLAIERPDLVHRALERAARALLARTKAVAAALPGRLWRIFGPEYASEPFLPPRLFREFVVGYDEPMVRAIRSHGGYARIHSHGRLESILDDIAGMSCDALDPIEPPPQGDIHLGWVRQRHGENMVLFGNLEVSDIETLPTPQFETKVRTALREGTAGQGRGFVLMPTACPYGRDISPLTLRNYSCMVELAESFG